MQLPESWLRAFVDPAISSEDLAHRLTMAGLEVEDAVPAAPPFSGVVVARVLSLAPHPDADKLRVCQVDDGSGTPLQIVCGAPNVAVDMQVPLARVGAKLPGDITIGMARMRGIESAGMLCSARELGLSQDHAGLMALPADAVPGTSVRDVLQLDDTIFTLKLTPNKADCLSILGVAREVAALTGAPLTVPTAQAVPVTISDVLPVSVQAPDLCGRFAGRVIRGVNAHAATPDWMKHRLERAGQRSISALVDISNYVMLGLGRPSHVFDLDKIEGPLTVRWGQAGESLALLNGQTVSLDDKVGVIADAKAVESLAGIMGGDATAVTLDTTNIYLEGAFWWPDAIAGRSRRYNFATDAGYRFERGVDYASIPEHLEIITALILEICGGQAGPLDDQIINLPERAPVRLRVARCQRVLGIAVSADDIAEIFSRLGLLHTREAGQGPDGEVFVVTPPSYRFDLDIEEDLIEEVARIYGFERIPEVPPLARAQMRSEPETLRGPHALRHAVAALDYQEVVNFSFVEEAHERDLAGNDNPIRLLNPIASQLSVMRSSLISGLVNNVRYNVNRKIGRVRVFELGRVFARNATVPDAEVTVAGIDQPLRLAGIAYGPAVEEQWGITTRQVDFFDVKADVEALLGARAAGLRCVAHPHPALHPGRSARLELDGQPMGWLGELHPRWMQEAELAHAPVVFELDVAALSVLALPVLAELSRQPAVSRDLALWVNESVTVQSMLDTIAATIAADPDLAVVREARLFDVWRDKSLSEKEKSLAFRFRLQDTAVTLDDARVDACLDRIREALVAAHDARQRN